RRRHTSCYRDWSSDVCSSDLVRDRRAHPRRGRAYGPGRVHEGDRGRPAAEGGPREQGPDRAHPPDRERGELWGRRDHAGLRPWVPVLLPDEPPPSLPPDPSHPEGGRGEREGGVWLGFLRDW